MTFELVLTRARSYEDACSEALVAPPITREAFEQLFTVGPQVTPWNDAFRVWYEDGDPFYLATLEAPGHIKLATSCSSHRFCRNFANLFDEALRAAECFPAPLRVFETCGGEEVTRANVDTLLAIDGPYVQREIGVWHRLVARLADEWLAPVEFPLGPFDVVSEFFVFELRPARPPTSEAVVAVLAARLAPSQIVPVGPTAWLVTGPEGRGLTRVVSDHGVLQITPAWGRENFDRIAVAAEMFASWFLEAFGGTLTFRDRPYDAELQRAFRHHAVGLGVDFLLWTQEPTWPEVAP